MLVQLLTAAGVLAVIGGMVWVLLRAARRGGEMESDLEFRKSTIEAIARANEGATEAVTGLRKGETPAQVKAKNDAKWGGR